VQLQVGRLRSSPRRRRGRQRRCDGGVDRGEVQLDGVERAELVGCIVDRRIDDVGDDRFDDGIDGVLE
jgi:hypothetical protein